MAIAFKAVATSQRTTGGTSMTATLPTFAAGDLLVAAFVTGDANSGLSGFAGWTHAFAEQVDGTVGIFDVYYKIADGSETNLSLSWTTNGKPQVIIASYSGVDSTTPVVAASGAVGSGTNASSQTPTVNNTGTGVEWALAFFTFRVTNSGNKSNTFTPPGGLTERSDVNMSAAGSSPWVSMELADSNGAVASGNHQYTATVVSGGNSAHKFGALLYLNPASGASPQTIDAGKVASGADVRGADLAPSGAATLSPGAVSSPEAVHGADLAGSGTATISPGAVPSPEAVHGADLSGTTIALSVGKIGSGEAVRGADLAPSGAASLSPGHVSSAADVRGADLAGSGSASLAPGHVPSSEAVNGADLAGVTATLSAGKVASEEAVRGADLDAGAAGQQIAPGKVPSDEAVRGADFDVGTANLAVGRVASGEAVLGVEFDLGTATLTVGKVPSGEDVHGADLTTGAAPQTLSVGKVASSAAVRGVGLDPVTATLSSGKVSSASAVLGADLSGTGTSSLLAGLVSSSEAVRGADLALVLAARTHRLPKSARWIHRKW